MECGTSFDTFEPDAVMTHDRAAPSVSVIIPAYEATAFVPVAIASALEQTTPPREVIVVNDASAHTDELERAITAFRHRITYLRQPKERRAWCSAERGLERGWWRLRGLPRFR